MTLFQNIFANRTARMGELSAFGFVERDGIWCPEQPLAPGQLLARVQVDAAGKASGAIIDPAFGDEYTAVDDERRTGAFVGQVREEWEELLRRLAESCFTDGIYRSDQANRLAEALKERFGEVPDFPFKNFPGYSVFRWPGNDKWYALVGTVHLSTLTTSPEERKAEKEKAARARARQKARARKAKAEGKSVPARKRNTAPAAPDPMVEIINVKVDAQRRDELLEMPGIYPCYHMNRATWVSVFLDGTVPDETLLELVEASRRAIMAVGGRAGGRSTMGSATGAEGGLAGADPEPRIWLVPANPKYYDIHAAFAASPEIDWKQSSDVRVGDTVYVYVGAPDSALRYRCVATAVNIPYDYADKNVHMSRVMRIRREFVYPADALPIAKLRELGITAIRGPRGVNEAFLATVAAIEEQTSQR